jgi:CheY-like chemotaxis protein
MNFHGKVKVLVAEDNPINQLLMKKVLESMNAQMVIVENGWLAVQQLKDEKFDAVLMDIQMPVMDGYQATMMIRQSISPLIPIIGVSANAFKEDVDRSINSGMDAHISKPFKPIDLFNTIQRLIAEKMSEL